jgi:hypothetical protein
MNEQELIQTEFYELMQEAFNRFEDLYSRGYVVMMTSLVDGFFISWKPT